MTDTILGTSKLSGKYQITIPKDAREQFELKEGDRLVFKNDQGRLVIEKA